MERRWIILRQWRAVTGKENRTFLTEYMGDFKIQYFFVQGALYHCTCTRDIISIGYLAWVSQDIMERAWRKKTQRTLCRSQYQEVQEK